MDTQYSGMANYGIADSILGDPLEGEVPDDANNNGAGLLGLNPDTGLDFDIGSISQNIFGTRSAPGEPVFLDDYAYAMNRGYGISGMPMYSGISDHSGGSGIGGMVSGIQNKNAMQEQTAAYNNFADSINQQAQELMGNKTGSSSPAAMNSYFGKDHLGGGNSNGAKEDTR